MHVKAALSELRIVLIVLILVLVFKKKKVVGKIKEELTRREWEWI